MKIFETNPSIVIFYLYLLLFALLNVSFARFKFITYANIFVI